MEIKTIEDVKKRIGLKVKFGRDDNVSENLKVLDVLEGSITKVTSNWEHTANGDTCVSWTTNVDVVDPRDGGIHHLTATRIFDLDEKTDDIINASINDELIKLEERKVELVAKIKINETIEEETKL